MPQLPGPFASTIESRVDLPLTISKGSPSVTEINTKTYSATTCGQPLTSCLFVANSRCQSVKQFYTPTIEILHSYTGGHPSLSVTSNFPTPLKVLSEKVVNGVLHQPSPTPQKCSYCCFSSVESNANAGSGVRYPMVILVRQERSNH